MLVVTPSNESFDAHVEWVRAFQDLALCRLWSKEEG